MLFEINVKTKLSLLNVWLACSLLMLLTLFKVLNVLWTVGTWSLLVIMKYEVAQHQFLSLSYSYKLKMSTFLLFSS